MTRSLGGQAGEEVHWGQEAERGTFGRDLSFPGCPNAPGRQGTVSTGSWGLRQGPSLRKLH